MVMETKKQSNMKILHNYIILLMLLINYTVFGQLGATQGNSSYKPIPGKTYVISGWVSELRSTPVIIYSSTIKVAFTDTNGDAIGVEFEFAPHGTIIDDWQRILGEFTIPTEAANIHISLVNKSGDIVVNDDAPSATESLVYFDDIRVHPFNGNLKSFVYDPQNQRLIAELDENNYATFYDYDKEGGLVRVKKETENGIYTIQETRSGNSKLNGN